MNATVCYLDHAAATPVDPAVLADMQRFQSEAFYNPSSPYAPAVMVRREYEAAKSRLAQTFGAKGEDIVITAGASESISLAFSVATEHVVVSAIEHDAVLAAAKQRSHTLVQPTNEGIIRPEAVQAALTDQTEMVSVQLANNEVGTIQPIRAIADIVHAERLKRMDQGNKRPIWFHCDASQGFGQIDVNVARLGVDLLTLNAGKMYGPKQVGALWLKPSVIVHPLVVGGGQERGLRSGTENVAGVIGFAKAAELSYQKRRQEADRLQILRDRLENRLEEAFPGMIVSGAKKRRLPGSLHISFPGLDGERLVFGLEAKGVLVATGSACAANKGTRSHVLVAMGMTDDVADGSLRITLGRLSDDASIFLAAEAIIATVTHEYERVRRA